MAPHVVPFCAFGSTRHRRTFVRKGGGCTWATQWWRAKPAKSQAQERLPQRGQRIQERFTMAPQWRQYGFAFTTIGGPP
jgi:hypothetical protein